MKILIVEDSPTVREMMIAHIQGNFPKMNNQYVCTDSIVGGLLSVQKNNLDVILLDLTLKDSDNPRKTLEAFLPTIKSGIPTIVFTGTHDEKLIIDAIKSGVVGYVEKPDLKNLYSALSNCFERRSQAEAIKRLEENYEDLQSQFDSLREAVSSHFPLVKDKEETTKGG